MTTVTFGHARVMVVFDMVYRWLKASGYDVTYVRNITDIDDKIIKRANRERRDHPATDRPLHRFHARGCRRAGRPAPDHEPRATEYRAADAGIIRPLRPTGWPIRRPMAT